MASKNQISENEKTKEKELGNNIRNVESVEMRNKEIELGKDREIELEVRERDSMPTKRVQYLKPQYVA